ncbi:hypothetical protein SVAN01_08031 [Stagonosporopsis vannaccii]|nr:hypothetical protein SVAN01_08031 [Stagonosporopsis vannaccii]
MSSASSTQGCSCNTPGTSRRC